MVPKLDRPDRSVGYGWSAVATQRTMRAGRDVREEVGTLGSGSESHVDGLTLPLLPAHHTISRPHSRVAHPFREPLHFIVMTVMVVISLYLWGLLHDGELLVYSGIVMEK